ncbi:MAG: hypothetical protein KF729_30620 [Sandaracinaceae bacterium]|nr:hypothetical protein [Sandaracinaceae bacterium]
MTSRSIGSVAVATLVALGCGQTHPAVDAAAVDAATRDAGASDATAPDASDGAVADAAVGPDPRALRYCLDVRELRCRGNQRCCPLEDRAFLDWFTSCNEVRIEQQCEEWASDTALRDGTILWDAVAAARVLETLAAAVETCGAISRPFDDSEVFVGTLDEGQDCTPDRPLDLSVGRFRCRRGLRCALEGDSEGIFVGVCAPLGGDGESCNEDCQSGLWCDGLPRNGGDPFRGRCAPSGSDARRCFRDTHCELRLCDQVTDSCVAPSSAETWCGYIG